MKVSRVIQAALIALALIGAGAAFLIAQERSYRIDPAGQTDRMETKGWPFRYRRIGGIAGFNERNPAAYVGNACCCLAPPLIIAASTWPWRRNA
jgi:hypothetical protein